MPDLVLAQVQACRTRVSRLDANGVPRPGAQNLYVTDAMSTLTLKAVYEAPTEISEKNACGGLAINFIGKPSLKRYDVDVTFLKPDPYLAEMLAGGDVLAAGGVGSPPGYAYPEVGEVDDDGGVSVEVWAKRIGDDGELDADFPYAWWVAPRVRDLRPGDRTFANAANLSMFTGRAAENDNWFDGPTNDWPAASDRILQWIPTAHLPDAHVGYQALNAS